MKHNRSINNYSVSGLSPSSGIPKLENTTYWNLDLFPCSYGGNGKSYTLGSLRRS
jgi:hypothetical protein